MHKNKKIGQKIQLITVASVVAITIAVAPIIAINGGDAKAVSLSELRDQAAVLGAQINQNNQAAADLAAQGETLKAKIAEYDGQISSTDAQIALINNKLAQLEIELKNAQTELDRQKGLLKASIKELYKKGDASSVELIVGSDSFTQFFNNQTYLDKLKSGVQESTEKVVALKQKIQGQKDEQAKLLKQEQDSRAVLAQARSERNQLLADTQGQESNYRNQVNSLRQQQNQVMAAIAARMVATGTVITQGSGNGGYPSKWANADYNNPPIDSWGMYARQCVSYTAFKVWQSGRNMPYWGGRGNANQWPSNARAAGWAVDRNPQVGDVAITYNGYYGHAMYVEAVNGRTVTVSQYNYIVNGQWGQYSEMTLSADNSALGPMTFIHFP
ncbi:CHAP domain-containing protein [Candidatus Saccharibacteria bacterium]|nr:CHAP domain-containing protein [Candidatus Saccharibacteria bacterium]MBP7834852.1 CHAP domain-containing protein [Candidatus Saccharibacteria bacterium]